MKKEMEVNGLIVQLKKHNGNDYFSLTDIAKSQGENIRPADLIKNWIRTRTTLEFIGTWEKLYNPQFKVVEFDHFKSQAGLPTFGLSPGLWKERTNAVGFIVIQGKYGGTYAHKDIAFEFCSAINPIFKLFLIKEFQRLKVAETNHQTLEWSVQRMISKINYHIHTDAIKENLIPNALTKEQATIIYANEADLLNVALFGMTSKQWHHSNPNFEGNIRDQATLEQLVVLSNMESINALLIQQGLNSQERIMQLNQVAITQMKSLITAKGLKRLNANQ
jgi:hypothetical protein